MKLRSPGAVSLPKHSGIRNRLLPLRGRVDGTTASKEEAEARGPRDCGPGYAHSIGAPHLFAGRSGAALPPRQTWVLFHFPFTAYNHFTLCPSQNYKCSPFTCEGPFLGRSPTQGGRTEPMGTKAVSCSAGPPQTWALSSEQQAWGWFS